MINPIQWLTSHHVNPDHPTVIYVAHPVAPRGGEILATCTACGAGETFAPADPVDLRLICGHDAPVKQTDDPAGIVAANLRRALAWWRWLSGLEAVVWAMPWFVNVTANGDGDPALIARGLRDDCEIVRRCDALMLCGPRVSSGMALEASHARAAGLPVFQVEGINRKPPPLTPPGAVPWRNFVP